MPGYQRKKATVVENKSAPADVPASSRSGNILIFTLDGQRYALYLSTVARVVRVVETTSLPKAPDIIQGVVDVQGQVVPVVNIRRRFHLPERDMELSDHLIIASTGRRTVALVVDSVESVIESPGWEIIPAGEILAGTEYIEGVIKLEDGLVLIHDLAKCLSLEEDRKLGTALKNS